MLVHPFVIVVNLLFQLWFITILVVNLCNFPNLSPQSVASSRWMIHGEEWVLNICIQHQYPELMATYKNTKHNKLQLTSEHTRNRGGSKCCLAKRSTISLNIDQGNSNWLINIFFGGARGVMVIVVGNGHETDCISRSVNTLGKGMNPVTLPPIMGKLKDRPCSSALVRQLV